MTSVIDIDKLLEPVSADLPCGVDLEYDEVYQLGELAAVKPEREMGGTVIPAEEPDWREVRRFALAATEKTKDLRVLVTLSRALAETEGFRGLRDGLALIRGLAERFWEGIYPPLDPDDRDPTFRVNTLSSLCDSETMLTSVRQAPLVESRALGRFSLRDIAVANGELAPPPGVEPPDMSAIDAAFMDADLEALKETADAISSATSDLRAIDVFVAQQVGAGNAPSLDELGSVLKEAAHAVGPQLERRGVGVPTAPEDTGAGAEPGAAVPARPVTGEISSREDVVRVLSKINDYYRRHEPSSPVPLLLERAKRLVDKDFMEIINDLAPAGLPEAKNIQGPPEE